MTRLYQLTPHLVMLYFRYCSMYKIPEDRAIREAVLLYIMRKKKAGCVTESDEHPSIVLDKFIKNQGAKNVLYIKPKRDNEKAKEN